MTQHTLLAPTPVGDLEREGILHALVGSLPSLPIRMGGGVRPNFHDTCHFKNDSAPRVSLELPEMLDSGLVLPAL